MDAFGIGRQEPAVVFVTDASGAIVARQVTKGVQDWEYTEILSGLAEGDTVVVHPSDRVVDGVRLIERE